jgi:hypothetical protein
MWKLKIATPGYFGALFLTHPARRLARSVSCHWSSPLPKQAHLAHSLLFDPTSPTHGAGLKKFLQPEIVAGGWSPHMRLGEAFCSLGPYLENFSA